MNHGKLVPEKPRTIKVVVCKTVEMKQVVTITIHQDDSNDSEAKAIATAQTRPHDFIQMAERYRCESQYDITDELPDPPEIEI